MPITRDELFAFLDKQGIKTTTIDHRPVFTVDEGRDIKARIPGGHTKNLFLVDKKSRLFVVVALGEAVINLKTLHEKIGASGRLSFGSAEKLLHYWGVTPGSVTAMGAINDTEGHVTVVLDEAMFVHDILNCHPLQNNATTSIHRDDLVRFLKSTGHDPLILRVSESDTAQTGEKPVTP